jgi:hypothetical protein
MAVHRVSRYAVLVGAVALMFAGAACGGGGSSGVTPSATVSATQAATETPATAPVATIVSPSLTPGPAVTLQLRADPQELRCDGKQSSLVTARVLDGTGQPVKDGTPVKFSVQALGTADPVDTETLDGEAKTSVTSLGERVGVVVNVTSGDVAVAIRIDCL